MLLQAFGGYTRASLGEEPAEWVLSMYRRLNPEAHEADLEARGEEQQEFLADLKKQGLSIEEQKRMLLNRRR